MARPLPAPGGNEQAIAGRQPMRARAFQPQLRLPREQQHPLVLVLIKRAVGRGHLSQRNDPLDPCAGPFQQWCDDFPVTRIGKVREQVRHGSGLSQIGAGNQPASR